MLLFDDTDMFISGDSETRHYDFPDMQVIKYGSFIPKPDADTYYTHLLHTTPWREYKVGTGEWGATAPRRIAWYGEEEETGFGTLPWTPELLRLKEKIELFTGCKFNALLINLYRDGQDGVGWHCDKEERLGKDPAIASLTFGQTRPFQMRNLYNQTLPKLEIPLHHGTLLLMHGTTNTFWQHQIPKTLKSVLPRINLTFRNVIL